MTERKKDPRYKHISGYIPVEIADRVREIVRQRGITLNEFQEEAALMWLSGEVAQKETTIFEVVARNLSKLKDSGIITTNLNAIAKGEVLPTFNDFSKITSALKLDDKEKQRLWDLTYKPKPESDDSG